MDQSSDSEDVVMDTPLYQRLCDLDPRLKVPFAVTVIGMSGCPFSQMAYEAVNQEPSLRHNNRFILFGEHEMLEHYKSASEFAAQTKYKGTYPLVFVQMNGYIVHIGGARDLQNWILKKKKKM